MHGATNDHSSGTINVESIGNSLVTAISSAFTLDALALADNNNVKDVRMKLDPIQRICEKAMATSANNTCNPGFVNTELQLLTPTKMFMDKADEMGTCENATEPTPQPATNYGDTNRLTLKNIVRTVIVTDGKNYWPFVPFVHSPMNMINIPTSLSICMH
ncbi:hypothetical protein AaE_015107 [Aphanomyces astaci]|uniref:Uncharacterized protein n=1 Tax=Aphanomyces astaci TaxID=112090 RepID=A0A6A4Z9T1_APHAT|nr:hypothetical protein AaE_015107 [Aphanomyces astaci]